MTNKKFSKLFGKNPRNPKSEDITQFHMDIAASIQQVTEGNNDKIGNFYT